MAEGSAHSIVIAGQEVPKRRFTGWALVYFVGLVALPILGIGVALDVVFYFLAKQGGWSCYGVLCLIG